MKILRRIARWGAVGFVALTLAACMPRAAGYQESAAATASPPAADPQEPFKEEARAMLRQEQFERLDRLADELVKTKARFPGGDWKSYRFQEALGKPAGSEKAGDAEWERHIAVLQRWHSARPDSIAAVLALTDRLRLEGEGHWIHDAVTLRMAVVPRPDVRRRPVDRIGIASLHA